MVKLLCQVKNSDGTACTENATKYFLMTEDLRIACCATHVPEGAVSYEIKGAES